MRTKTFEIAVCSWSLQVTSIPELTGFLDQLGINHVQIACGDPHHASWIEGEALPEEAKKAGFVMTGAMLGFPGEDYSTPRTIEKTGGFGDPTTRHERLERLKWGLVRTRQLGLSDLMLHAGFIPESGDPARRSFLDTLALVADLAAQAGITIAFETGQESAQLLRHTLEELDSPNLKVNFDPANMLLYDKDEPLQILDLLAPYIKSVHLKDANRPLVKGQWGEEVPLGRGQTNTKEFLKELGRIGYEGPLCIEREVGTQSERFGDIAHGIRFLRECMKED
jgi:sugar phosphate isomerase/epimerase